MNIVLFSEKENGFLPAADTRTRHICDILKKKTGDSFEAGIENKTAGTALITAIDKTGLYFTFTEKTEGQKPFPVDLIIGFPRPIQLKRLLRDVSSLGVSRIFLTGTELGEKSYMSSKLMERGAVYAALKEGSVQAKSAHVPFCTVYPSTEKCLSALGSNKDIFVCLDNAQPQMSLSTFLSQKLKDKKYREDAAPSGTKAVQNCSARQNGIRITAAIGSERGWSERERNLFKQKGFTLCSMGERILRTETACTAATVIILQALGVL